MHSLSPPSSPVEVERAVDRRPGRPGDLPAAAVERRRAVALIDGGPGEVTAAVGVGLRLAVVEDAAGVVAVGVIDWHLLAARWPKGHEHDEDDDADERHQDQVADRSAAHLSLLFSDRSAVRSAGSTPLYC